jgi:hypothetical protein
MTTHRPIKKIALFMLLAIASVSSFAANDDVDDLRATTKNEWVMIKNDRRQNIKAWSKIEEGKRLRSFKIEGFADTSMESLARTIVDADNYTRFFWECYESRMLKIVSPTDFYAYLKINIPQPVPDRDMVLHGVIEPYTKKNGYMMFRFTASPHFLPSIPNLVRVPEYTFWIKLTPIDAKQVRFDMEGFVDPGGSVPIWAVNFMQRAAPYTSMVGLFRRAELISFDTPSPFRFFDERP